jgi:L-amino acid N-acyltransferase YncA
MLIENMRADDWDSVRRIYEEGLATGNAGFEVEALPWPAWDERHHGHSRLVARAAGRVIRMGWLTYSCTTGRRE